MEIQLDKKEEADINGDSDRETQAWDQQDFDKLMAST